MNIDELCINTIRFLAVDSVQKANSGHPGMPLGAAPIAYTLWDRFLKFNPDDPKWPNRDRFILSAGHASALLYSLLHLTGYDVSIEDLENFRQWHSKTPGHPEYGSTPGVETTTGPLGQGFANGVGMAIAGQWLAARYNKPGYEIIDHYIYALVSDGDMMEGVSSEAASLAGTLKLNRLIYFYDQNGISIEGSTGITFDENVGQRFQAYGWNVIGPVDGNDIEAVASAIKEARQEPERPNLIICRTVIGYGSPNKAGKASAHGEGLGVDEVKLTKEKLGWHYPDPFTVPPEVREHFNIAKERGAQWQKEWEAKLEAYREHYPEESKQFDESLKGKLPRGWDKELKSLFKSVDKLMATREASGEVINAIWKRFPFLIGGSADLAPSVKTAVKGQPLYSCSAYGGCNFAFGVREHAMGAIANGIALQGGVIPYTGTFLVFYDYMRAPVRLAALMGIRCIFLFSHDSIGLGEDGPTHQPVEQLMGLRTVPNLITLRPADAVETVEAWKIAMENQSGPTALVLSRQGLPAIDRTAKAAETGVKNGAYIVWESHPFPDVILIGTGSELHIALEAGKQLQQNGLKVRVISMPSWELFENQTVEYRNYLLPSNVRARISIEAGVTLGWERYVGIDGIALGMSRFGASAPGKVLYEEFHLTPQRIVEVALQWKHKK
jgi:transketolase